AHTIRARGARETLCTVPAGRSRCPGPQQGYSPFPTWTRGLAWMLLGAAEEAEFLATLDDAELAAHGGPDAALDMLLRAAEATADYYIATTPVDGVPYWDTGAPGLAAMPDPADRPADPWNEHEPVDSSAAAIAAQGLLRLGAPCAERGRTDDRAPY